MFANLTIFNYITYRKFTKLKIFTGQHAAHVLNLLVISNEFYKIRDFFISLFLCRTYNALCLFLVIAKL